MTNTDNLYARFPGASIQHLLVRGTKTTLCGKDATLAHRYPALTRANSADRRPFRTCTKCDALR
jgi:hypothetical protein